MYGFDVLFMVLKSLRTCVYCFCTLFVHVVVRCLSGLCTCVSVFALCVYVFESCVYCVCFCFVL